jgi:hypothetical protein
MNFFTFDYQFVPIKMAILKAENSKADDLQAQLLSVLGQPLFTNSPRKLFLQTH